MRCRLLWSVNWPCLCPVQGRCQTAITNRVSFLLVRRFWLRTFLLIVDYFFVHWMLSPWTWVVSSTNPLWNIHLIKVSIIIRQCHSISGGLRWSHFLVEGRQERSSVVDDNIRIYSPQRHRGWSPHRGQYLNFINYSYHLQQCLISLCDRPSIQGARISWQEVTAASVF